MALKRGYSAVPGTARRIRTPSGETISHRAYRNLGAKDAGWRSQSERENDRAFRGWQIKARIAGRRERDVGRGSRFERDYVRLKRQRERGRERNPPGTKLNRSPIGRLLIDVGVADRDQVWTEGSP